MNITILGSGNIAYFMATRLAKAGHSIVEIYDREPDSATLLANFIKSKPVSQIKELSPNSDLYILAVPDKVLNEIALLFPFKDKLVIHCAGAATVDIMDFENTGVIWPLYSIKKENLPTEKNIPLFWEAKGETALKIIPEIANEISDNVLQTSFSQREELHLSAVFVNNFVNHLMTITNFRIKKLGLDFKQVLEPIIHETIFNALANKSFGSQTGPAIRGDEVTMKTHLELLAEHPEWQEIYRSISASIQQFYTEFKK